MKQDQPPRTAEIQRKTAETDITLSLTIDGSGTASIDTGVGFLDHMLTLFSVHGEHVIEKSNPSIYRSHAHPVLGTRFIRLERFGQR